ncbi:hypothetical protein Q7O_003477 [Pectobacterium carotovorum subsp. carotovorum PCCS1]|nr:hypothetical protein [Pectobacterium carotovorum subsp. carotovorum PCCS1]
MIAISINIPSAPCFNFVLFSGQHLVLSLSTIATRLMITARDVNKPKEKIKQEII